MIFFVLVLGLRLQRKSANTKRYPPTKSFWKLWVLFFPPKSQFSKLLGLRWFGGKNKTQSFQKVFVGGYFLVFVKYLCNRSLIIKTKNIKNYSLILAIINHQNWIDDSPPLSVNKQRFQIFHPTIFLSHTNLLFWKIFMTSLHVICGLGLHQSKILGKPMNWRSPEKLFWRPFLKHLRLCPWSLALASSIPVLGLESVCPRKAVLGLGLGFFLCPWPWPRALCPRLHLCCRVYFFIT